MLKKNEEIAKAEREDFVEVSTSLCKKVSSLEDPDSYIDKRRLLLTNEYQLESNMNSSVGMGIGSLSSFKMDSGLESELDYWLYRQPEMDKAGWETKPRSYSD